MADRPAAALDLQLQLAAETGVPVTVRWDATTDGRGRRWHVLWSDGPTRDAMEALVDRLLPRGSALDRDALVYVRTIQPISVALAIVRNVRLGLPPLGDHHQRAGCSSRTWSDVPYPERGTDADLAAGRRALPASSHAGDAASMATAISRHGLTGLAARSRRRTTCCRSAHPAHPRAVGRRWCRIRWRSPTTTPCPPTNAATSAPPAPRTPSAATAPTGPSSPPGAPSRASLPYPPPPAPSPATSPCSPGTARRSAP